MLMRFAVHLLPVILPVLFWAGYHYYKDRHLPEPVSHLALAFILGVGSFYLGMFMYRAPAPRIRPGLAMTEPSA
jgi:RsiW-degrading membrane proteinase PrsW (M82 family)